MKGKDIFRLVKSLSKADKVRLKKYLVGKPAYLTELFDKINQQDEFKHSDWKDRSRNLNAQFDRLRDEILIGRAYYSESKHLLAVKVESAIELSEMGVAALLIGEYATVCQKELDYTGMYTAHKWKDIVELSSAQVSLPPNFPSSGQVIQYLRSLERLKAIYKEARNFTFSSREELAAFLLKKQHELDNYETNQDVLLKFWRWKIEVLVATFLRDFNRAVDCQKIVISLFSSPRISPNQKLRELKQLSSLFFLVGDYENSVRSLERIADVESVSGLQVKSVHIDLLLRFSFDAGDLQTGLFAVGQFKENIDLFSERKRARLSFVCCSFYFFNKDYRAAIKWANNVFQVGFSDRKEFHWAIYLIQALSFWSLKDNDGFESYKQRSIRSSKTFYSTPAIFLNAFPNKEKSAKLLGELSILESDPIEREAFKFFRFKEFLIHYLGGADFFTLLSENYKSRLKSHPKFR